MALRLPRLATPTILPLSVMTGSWSKPSLTMMSMACSTDTLGRMVRGAERSRELTFSSALHDSCDSLYDSLVTAYHQVSMPFTSMMSLSAHHWSSRNLVM